MRPNRLAATVATVLACLLAPASAPAAWRWPVVGPVITPYANGSDPYAGGQHRGIDVAAPVGTPVVAAAAGVVTFAGTAGSSGLTVAIRTDDGFDTSYLHLSATSVRAGDRVPAGAPIGRVGTSGRRSAAPPHLHLGVRDAGTRFAYRDPLDLLPVPPPVVPPRVPLPVTVPASLPRVPLPAALRPRAVPLALPVRLGPLALPLRPRPSTVPVRSRPAPLAAPRDARVLPAIAPAAPTTRVRTPGLALHPPATHAPPAPHAPPGPRTPPADRPAHRPDAASSAPAAGPAARAQRPVGPPAAGPSRAAANRPGRPTLATPRRHAARPNDRGLDVGWLAACVAMVAAAAILGRPRAAIRSLRQTFELPSARLP